MRKSLIGVCAALIGLSAQAGPLVGLYQGPNDSYINIFQDGNNIVMGRWDYRDMNAGDALPIKFGSSTTPVLFGDPATFNPTVIAYWGVLFGTTSGTTNATATGTVTGESRMGACRDTYTLSLDSSGDLLATFTASTPTAAGVAAGVSARNCRPLLLVLTPGASPYTTKYVRTPYK